MKQLKRYALILMALMTLALAGGVVSAQNSNTTMEPSKPTMMTKSERMRKRRMMRRRMRRRHRMMKRHRMMNNSNMMKQPEMMKTNP